MAFVQKVLAAFVSSGANLTATITGVAAGNSLIWLPNYFQSGGAPALPTTTFDGVTNTPVFQPAQSGDGINNVGNAVHLVQSAAAGSHTFTTTLQAGSFGNGTIVEWSNLAASAFDQSNVQNTTTAQACTVAPTGTLAQANEVVFASLIFISNGVANAAITDPPATYTNSLCVFNDTLTENGVEQSYKEVTATTGVGAAWTWTDASGVFVGQGIVATFKESSGGATNQQVDSSNRQRPGRGPYSKGRYYRPDTTAYTSAPPAITGSGAAVEANDTATGAGAGTIPATGAATEAHDVVNATTGVADGGSSASTEANDTVNASGATAVPGSGAPVEPADVVNAAGGNTDGGSAAIPEPADTASGAGSVGGVDNGSGAVVEPSDVVTASGGATDSATGAAQESPDVVNASGTPTDPGSGAPLEQPDTVAGAGIVGGGGVGAVVEPPDTVAASGTATDSGSGSAQDGSDQVNASGTPTDSGSGASSESHDIVTASGASGPGGTGGPVEPPDTASGAGASTDSGAGASAENPDIVSAAGQTATSGSAAAGESHDVVTAAGTVRQPGFSFPRGAVIVVEFDFFSERLIPTAPDDRRITIGAS